MQGLVLAQPLEDGFILTQDGPDEATVRAAISSSRLPSKLKERMFPPILAASILAAFRSVNHYNSKA